MVNSDNPEDQEDEEEQEVLSVRSKSVVAYKNSFVNLILTISRLFISPVEGRIKGDSNGERYNPLPGSMIIFFLLCLLIMSTVLVSHTILMAHHSPVTTVEGLSFGDLNSSDPDNATAILNESTGKNSSSFGWTYGNLNQPLYEQTSRHLVLIGSIPLSWPIGILAGSTALLIGFCRCHKNQSQYRDVVINISVFFLTVAIYVAVTILTYVDNDKIKFITLQGEATENILSAHDSFYFVLFFQGAILALTAFVWSQPLAPKYDEVSITQHTSNWRTYGNWIGSFFGAIGITVGLAFLKSTNFGFIFVRHFMILIGLSIIMNLGFVAYKLRKLETVDD